MCIRDRLWTVFRTKEYSPQQYNQYKGIDVEAEKESQATDTRLLPRLIGFFKLMTKMPSTMKQLAVVQFFSWFSLFIMWVYSMPAIAQHTWGVDVKWFDPDYLATVTVPAEIAAAKGAAGDWVGILFAGYSLFAVLFSLVLGKVADKFGRKLVYGVSLALSLIHI